MKTLVYQSYRTVNVPEWIKTCMETVQKWASFKGYDYYFIDDELFNYVPDWFRKGVEGMKLPQTDYARLIIGRNKLQEGYDCVIWMDADVVIFDIESFELDNIVDYAMCKEIWFEINKLRHFVCTSKINNAVMIYSKNNNFLDFYIDSCEKMVKSKKYWVLRLNESNDIKFMLSRLRYFYRGFSFMNTTIGPKFLTSLYKLYDFPVITNVGIISPMLMKGILTGNKKLLRFYINMIGNKIFAANMCGSFVNTKYNKYLLTNDKYEKTKNLLIDSNGSVINDYLIK